MAYLASALRHDDLTFAPMASPETPAPLSPAFTPLEWRVIELAARDGLATLEQPGMLRGLARHLFGTRAGSPLADQRLELLRRAAVRSWRTGAMIEQKQVEALIAAGYSLSQISLLSRHIDRRRATR